MLPWERTPYLIRVAEQESRQGNILVVMDVSGAGRCSALVSLPVLSLSGISCALLPTAYYSTHTGGFGEVHRKDLSETMERTVEHWLRLKLQFDAVYIGYTASENQLKLLEQAVPNLLSPEGRLYIDPVMGDHGRRYSFCEEGLINGFRCLCTRADVIFPNRTEAALLLGLPLNHGVEPEPPAPEQLLSIGSKSVVLTGVRKGENQIGVLAASSGKQPFFTSRQRFENTYPGTGDLLASCIIAVLQMGGKLERACDIACDFLDLSLRHTVLYGAQPRFGLAFEAALPALAQVLTGSALKD